MNFSAQSERFSHRTLLKTAKPAAHAVLALSRCRRRQKARKRSLSSMAKKLTAVRSKSTKRNRRLTEMAAAVVVVVVAVAVVAETAVDTAAVDTAAAVA